MLETPQVQQGSTLLQKQEVPNYWPLYGLNQPPFEEEFHREFYYPLPESQQILEHFKDLTKNRHRLTLVTGALCCGKSALISQFIALNNSELRIYVLKSHVAIHVTDLLSFIRSSFGFTSDHDLHPDQFKNLLTLLEQQKKHHIVFVDDAHRLPLESLSALIQLTLAQESESVYLHVVLFGEPQLMNRTKNLLEILAHPAEFPQFNLRSFNLEETKNYIQYRLHKAGLNSNTPLNETVLTRIYRLSGGLPGKINRVAQQYLSEILPKNQILLSTTQTNIKNRAFTLNKFLVRLMHSTFTLIILSLVFYYLYNLVSFNHSYSQKLILIPAPKQDLPFNLKPSTPIPPLEPVAQTPVPIKNNLDMGQGLFVQKGEMTISPILRGSASLPKDELMSHST